MRARLLILLGTLLLGGCSLPQQRAPGLTAEQLAAESLIQQQLALQRYQAMRQRIADISWPLLRTAATQCPGQARYRLGLRLHNPHAYPSDQRAAAKALYGDRDGLLVAYLPAQSPAAARLHAGDRLLELAQQPLPSDPVAATAQIHRQLGSDGAPVSLLLERDGEPLQQTLQPELICDYPIYLSTSDTVNAYAEGDDIRLNAGLLRFADEDEALALIIAHEIAHNTAGHIRQRLHNGALGLLLDIGFSAATGTVSPGILGGLASNLYSQSFEIEADLHGLQLMHQAGFDIRKVPPFWRRIAAEHPAMIHNRQQLSHPTSVQRYLIMQQEVARLLDATATTAETPSAMP